MTDAKYLALMEWLVPAHEESMARIARLLPQPLSADERKKIKLLNGQSWKYSSAARYEATIQQLEADLEISRNRQLSD